MLPLYPAQQLLRGIAAPITATLPDADGEPAPGLTVTVTITDSTGAVVRNNVGTTDNGDGTYSCSMTALELAALAWLTADWKVGGVSRATTLHEVVGGFYFSLAAVNAWDENIAELGLDNETIRRTRATVEQAFERMTGVAFVPRLRRAVLHGSNLPDLLLPDPMVRRLRSVTFRSTSTSSTTLDANDLAALTVDQDGILRYLNNQGVTGSRGSSGVFPWGNSNVVVEYEHGYDRPPNELADAGIAYLRERLQRPRNAVPDRAISYTVTAGGTYRLATPDGWSTGNPDIDAILERHAWPTIGLA